MMRVNIYQIDSEKDVNRTKAMMCGVLKITSDSRLFFWIER